MARLISKLESDSLVENQEGLNELYFLARNDQLSSTLPPPLDSQTLTLLEHFASDERYCTMQVLALKILGQSSVFQSLLPTREGLVAVVVHLATNKRCFATDSALLVLVRFVSVPSRVSRLISMHPRLVRLLVSRSHQTSLAFERSLPPHQGPRDGPGTAIQPTRCGCV